MSREKSQKQREKTEIQIRLQEAFNGMSLSDISKMLGYNYSSLWNWTSGRTEMPNEVLAKLARMNVSVNWLLTGEGHPARKAPTLTDMLDLHIREISEDEAQKVVRSDMLVDIVREIVRQELFKGQEKDDVGGEVGPITGAEMILAPVVAYIGPGSTISSDEIDEIEKRLTPRKKKTG